MEKYFSPFSLAITITCTLSVFLPGLKGQSSPDTVANYLQLKIYSGKKDTVYIAHERYHGSFVKDTCRTENFGTKILTASGCWQRIHQNFSPRFWAIGGRSPDRIVGSVNREIDAVNSAATDVLPVYPKSTSFVR